MGNTEHIYMDLYILSKVPYIRVYKVRKEKSVEALP